MDFLSIQTNLHPESLDFIVSLSYAFKCSSKAFALPFLRFISICFSLNGCKRFGLAPNAYIKVLHCCLQVFMVTEK